MYLGSGCMAMETTEPRTRDRQPRPRTLTLGATEATISEPSHGDHCRVIPKKVDAGGCKWAKGGDGYTRLFWIGHKLEVHPSCPESPRLLVLIGPVDVERGVYPSQMEY